MLLMKNMTDSTMHAFCHLTTDLHKHSCKRTFGWYLSSSWKTDPAITITGIRNILPKGKSSFYSNLIFTKSFLYSIGSAPSIVLIWIWISFQIFVYFSNISLFLSVEAKIKYLFPLLSLMHRFTLLKIR